MSAHAVLDLLACAGHLAVGNLVLLRSTGSPLAIPLGLLALDLFGWNFADFAYTISGTVEWHWLDLSLSPFCGSLLLQLVAAFVGGRRAYRSPVIASYALFTLLAATAWLAFVWPPARSWLSSRAYSGAYLAAEVATIALSTAILVIHLRRTDDPGERTRTKMMIAAALIGGAFVASDFIDDLGIPVPSLSNVGTTISTLVMAFACLRFRLLGKNLLRPLAIVALLLSMVGLGGYLAAFRWLSAHRAVLMVSTITITLMLMAGLRQVGNRYLARRERVEALATVGRFSTQLAHDLNNPLAALKGALQFLKGEVTRGRSLATQGEMLDLLLAQADRMYRIVDDYQRVGHMQPSPSLVDLNRAISEVLALQRFAARGIAVETVLEDDLPLCWVDRGLFGRAIENLVCNAADAMPEGGMIRVETERLGTPDRPRAVRIAVRDTGSGMDARLIDRAFDDFFTTKAQGSGLGLAFVRRVVRTHAGHIDVASAIGKGTTVTLQLPVRATAGEPRYSAQHGR